MKRHIWLLTLIIAAALCFSAQAKETDIKSLPGYVDLEKIRIPGDAEEVMDIDLGPALLDLAAKSDQNGDHSLSKMLGMIKSIRVKAFSLEDDQIDDVRSYMTDIQDKLNADEWERLIYIKDDEEFVIVSIKHHDDTIGGLMVMAFEDGDEATFVNVVGNIDLAALVGMLGGLHGADIDIEGLLEEIEHQKHQKHHDDD